MNNGIMCDYFDYDGIRYYAGSKFKCNNFVKTNVQLFQTILFASLVLRQKKL